MNAYVGPVVEQYLRSLETRLAEAGVSAPLQIMQSSGGVMSAAAAMRKPAHLLESGPAAGVVACAYLARAAGIPNVISLDMGGTTAKAAILEDGEPVKTSEYEVGAGINGWPAVAGDTLLVPAGVQYGEVPPGLLALRLEP